MTVTALGLFSGGLDSILACRVVAEQGIRVVALKFVTPFFDHDLLTDVQGYQQEVREKYGLEAEVVDLSDQYLAMLRQPVHGFGKHFNPCIDCKILMFRRAHELMAAHGASFLISGEVLGQRPMSQRRDTLRVIARDSGCADILLRPLSARCLESTDMEREGLVDRQRLFGFSGRGRRQQIELAASYGITSYPAPAGGCLLTDPNLAARIAAFHRNQLALTIDRLEIEDFNLMHLGRQFRLDGGHWLILGRNERENERLQRLLHPGDLQLQMVERPGPLGLLRRADLTLRGQEAAVVIDQAARVVARYAKKVGGQAEAGTIEVTGSDGTRRLSAAPMTEQELEHIRI
jgi:tRNA-uridine 2-sulfurtransferase